MQTVTVTSKSEHFDWRKKNGCYFSMQSTSEFEVYHIFTWSLPKHLNHESSYEEKECSWLDSKIEIKKICSISTCTNNLPWLLLLENYKEKN